MVPRGVDHLVRSRRAIGVVVIDQYIAAFRVKR